KAPCQCTRRKRGEDFNALSARLEREDAEKGIPQQDFSYGVEVTTKDGKVWACGARAPTEEQAKFYLDYWERADLRKHGYATWERTTTRYGYGSRNMIFNNLFGVRNERHLFKMAAALC